MPMDRSARRTAFVRLFLGFVILAGAAGSAFALQVPQKGGRFDGLVVANPAGALDVATTPVEKLPASDALKAGWDQFRAAHGTWSIYLDRHSGAPLLVEGQGISWPASRGAVTVDTLASSLRTFLAANRSILLADDAELTLNREASGELITDVWQVVFDRTFAGVPVDGERYLFTIGHGRLISFGTPRWSRIDVNPLPDVTPAEAQDLVSAYMKLTAADAPDFFDKTKLAILPLRASGGAIGDAYTSALVWQVSVRIPGEPETWLAQVDAHTGAIVSFEDVNEYARAKGGVYPVSDDQVPPDGVEQANYPMPFAKIIINAAQQFATNAGIFTCSPAGATASTALDGKYFQVSDSCGTINQTVTCDNDIDFKTSSGTDCTVPAGASAGDTHAARSSFYHLNKLNEHARAWLPSNTWLQSKVQDNVNGTSTQCNAFWDGANLNFFRSTTNSCRNTGEIAGIFLHEWGHGLDANDGGGSDNPSEAYADITALIALHKSCVGRGFQFANCTGYGNACLNCTGVRDMDWRLRHDDLPSTPTGFVNNHCQIGNAPCGREPHCEGYVGGETIWDLANHDLVDAGMDLTSAWQLTDKLWYKSRTGSGGNAWSCNLSGTPTSDGCAATSWFSKLRAIDDDDGNLANGTPHAAAIWAAFARHGIACGSAGDQSNQSSSICPTLQTTTLSNTIGNGVANLSWTPVPNATSYRILRNDAGCDAGSTIIATVSGATTYQDTGLANGFTEYYTVQPLVANAACDGAVSNCSTATPEPFAGSLTLSALSYSCTGSVGVTVVDGNIGSSTSTVSFVSNTETTPEIVTVTQVSPGSNSYTGTLTLTGAPPVHDGVLSVVNGDTITGTYIDASDGGGGTNIPRTATASVDCIAPTISKVQTTNVTGTAARVTWTTNELANGTVHYGTAPPPSSTTTSSANVLGHAVDLNGLTECTPYVYSVDSADVVGNVATDNAGGAFYAFSTGKSTQPSFLSTDTPIAIPDNSIVGATSIINVTDMRTVQDVNVTFNIQHTFDSDLTGDLIAPTGLTIRLFNPHGGSGDNYTNTTLDDQAAGPLGGPPPFTGTFKPDSPLNVANGIPAAGAWKFFVVDHSPVDTGSILNWTLQLTYATPTCGPHAIFKSETLVADNCVTGGVGNLDLAWEAGEHIQFKLNLLNDGTTTLTGVTATVSTATPGAAMFHATASFPDLPAGAAADSLAPHFTVFLDPSMPCGTTIAFQVAINSDQGSWTGSFTQFVGRSIFGVGRVLNETFDSGIPATWTVIDGGSGGGAASRWTTNNPGVRTILPPMAVPAAVIDSDAAGPGATQDEALLTPVLDMSAATTAVLQFDQFFRTLSAVSGESADVDVRSSVTGEAWVTVLHQQGASTANPDHRTIDISAQAAGAADAQIRFHYWNAANDQYWQVDDVIVDTSAPGHCDMPTCFPPAPSGAKPVADGFTGLPMKASRGDALAGTINLTWDVTSCASADQHVIYGDLGNVAALAVTGGFCSLGTSGSAAWTGVPAGDLWFVVVGDDDAGTEGTWGTDATSGQRGGATVSGQCGITIRDNTGTCP
jgi:subtilisin-like proprotein convertase family protein